MGFENNWRTLLADVRRNSYAKIGMMREILYPALKRPKSMLFAAIVSYCST